MRSRTLCDLPKVASLKYTYAGLVNEAKKGNTMLVNYLDWVLTAGQGKSPKVDDLRNYLKVVHYKGPASEMTVTYPGSSVQRKFG